MTTFNSFQGKPKLKEALIASSIKHRIQDDYISGDYGEHNNSTGRFNGCSVGCSLYDLYHSYYYIVNEDVLDFSDHNLLAKLLGIPKWLALLQDKVFEGLVDPQLQSLFNEQYFTAMPVGVDLDNVKHHLAIRRLNRVIVNVTKWLIPKNPAQRLLVTDALLIIEYAVNLHKLALKDEMLHHHYVKFADDARKTQFEVSEQNGGNENWYELSQYVLSAIESFNDPAFAAWLAANATVYYTKYWIQERDDLLELLILAGEK